MATIKELFHKVGNLHNKISIGAGLNKEIIKRKSKDKSLSKEMSKLLIERLSKLEKLAITADKFLLQLKDTVYGILYPNMENQKAKGGKSDDR